MRSANLYIEASMPAEAIRVSGRNQFGKNILKGFTIKMGFILIKPILITGLVFFSSIINPFPLK